MQDVKNRYTDKSLGEFDISPGANLRGADLRDSDLRWADLRWANLRRADLSGADLRWADLRDAIGKFSIFSGGRHTGIAVGGYIAVGCERHKYTHWLENFSDIGEGYCYTPDEIERYGNWIKSVSWVME